MSSFEDIETLLSIKVILVVVSGGLVGCIWIMFSVNSGPLLRFSMRFEFLSEI